MEVKVKYENQSQPRPSYPYVGEYRKENGYRRVLFLHEESSIVLEDTFNKDHVGTFGCPKMGYFWEERFHPPIDLHGKLTIKF